MVKMNLGEVRTQTADIKSYCRALREGANNLNSVASAIGLEIGISGKTGNSIKSYLSSMYPALAKTMIMHADGIEEANQAYVDGYVSMCGGKSLDSEVLEKQIASYDSSIQSLESSKASQEQWYRGQDIATKGAIREEYQEYINSLASSIATNEKERGKLKEKLDKLLTFNGQSSAYFSITEETKGLMNEGLSLLGGDISTGKIGTGSWNGQGFTKIETNWQTRVHETWEELKEPEIFKEPYGGDQGSARYATGEEKERIYEIIRQYYPNMTEDEMKILLSRLNNEGCGYVAITNSLFIQYKGKEEEFEKTFGFPMFRTSASGKKEYNFNALIVDLYCATDNHNADKFLWFTIGDKVNKFEDYDKTDGDKKDYKITEDQTGSGTNSDNRNYRIQKYLDDHNAGISASVDSGHKISVNSYNDLLKKGDVMVKIYEGETIYKENDNGELSEYMTMGKNEGHIMAVTGIDDQGNLIVSSWGERYIIKTKECKNGDLEVITYE